MGWAAQIWELQHWVNAWQGQSERPAPGGQDFSPWLHMKPKTVKPAMALSIPIYDQL